jgi:putative ABC transport system permease protein
VGQNLRLALRTLFRNPAFAATAIATLALGIAVNTTIFSVVNGILLRPLPYRDSSRLVLLWTTFAKQSAFELSSGYRTAQDWKEQSRSLEAMIFWREEPVVLQEEPEAEPLEAAYVTPNFFTELGVQPALGRAFTAEEAARGDRIAVLSHALWKRRFAASPSVIGRSIRIEGHTAVVAGIMPESFRPLSRDTEMWMPDSASFFFAETKDSRDPKFGWGVLARLRPGVGLAQAQAEMDGIASRTGAAYPNMRNAGVRVVPLLDQVTSKVRLGIELLFAAVAGVLLIACANLGNLLLARAAGRTREVAVRTALGASRRQLIGQFLAESAVLAAIAGVLGFGLAALGLRALLAAAPGNIPRLNEVSLDLRTLLFTLTVSCLAAILFGLGPALRLAGNTTISGSRVAGGNRGARRLRDSLVVAEFAFAMLLLACAGLLVRSLNSVLRIDPGFHSTGVLTVDLHTPSSSDPSKDPLNPIRFAQLVEQLEAIPGIQAAGGISRYFQANAQRGTVTVSGGAPVDTVRPVNYDVIAGHYLQAVGAPLLRGRYFGPQDGPNSAKVVLVNEAFARAFLPSVDPVGQVFHRGNDSTGYTIAGVTGNMRRQEITSEPIPEVFWPHTQRPWGMNLMVRTSGDPLAFAGAVRKTLHDFDPSVVIQGMAPLERRLDDRIAQRRFQTWLLGLFAALAVALAGIGIYGLMHYAVAERTQEIGVRMALGARPADVFGLVLGHAAKLAFAGIAAGILGSLWATRMLLTMLYGVGPHDPVTYAGVSILLAGIALMAAAVPARRAMRCDPMIALRQE